MSKPVCLVVLYPGGKYAKENPDLLGAAENGLGLKEFIESHGYEFVSTSDKEGDDSVFDKYLPRAEIIVTTPFYPAYVTRERINKAPNLKICVTAGVGSDHVSLDTCNERGISVLEVTGSNVQSVAEHIIMTMLVLIRNYNEGHYQAISGGWDVAAVATNERDLEGKVIGCVAAGRIARLVFQRLASFNVKKIYYYDYQELPAEEAEKINSVAKILYGTENLLERVEDLEELVSKSDVITINCPLYDKTRDLFDEKLISKMKKGAILVNTARGAIANKEGVVKGVDSGKFTQNGIQYGGDVWSVQPAPKDDPWRSMKGSGSSEAFVGNAMTIHTSGTSMNHKRDTPMVLN